MQRHPDIRHVPNDDADNIRIDFSVVSVHSCASGSVTTFEDVGGKKPESGEAGTRNSELRCTPRGAPRILVRNKCMARSRSGCRAFGFPRYLQWRGSALFLLFALLLQRSTLRPAAVSER